MKWVNVDEKILLNVESAKTAKKVNQYLSSKK